MVNVFRLITRGTLEEKIMGLQKFKMHIANSVVNHENAKLETMNTSELLDLFDVSDSVPTATAQPAPTPGADAATASLGAPVGRRQSASGLQAMLDAVGELWSNEQYAKEYDLQHFLSTI